MAAPARTSRTAERSAPRTALAVETIAVVALVARDGEPVWIAVRVVAALAISRAVLRAGPRARLAAGIVGTAAGGAVAVPHVVKDGLGGTAIAALALLASGLLLALGSTLWLLRRARGWHRLLAVPIGFVVLQLGVLPIVGAVAATNVPPTSVGARQPSDLGLAYEDVALEAPDGVALSAWYVPGRNRAAVVMLHGAGSTRAGTLDHAAVLAEAGYATLLLDGRGHGRSGGDAMDFGWFGNRDVQAAVDWLAARDEIDPDRIAALGLSMGAEQAITAAAVDDRILAVVAEGATIRVPADAGFVAGGLHGIVRRTVERLMFELADLLTSASPPIALRDAVAAVAPRHVLLIAGTPSDEVPSNRWLQRVAPASVEVWESNAEHTGALDEHPTEWRARVLDHLDRYVTDAP